MLCTISKMIFWDEGVCVCNRPLYLSYIYNMELYILMPFLFLDQLEL
jgi:hypothetical protein